ncbi:NAD-dependent epimerase/dehydratase family protein [Ilumatobacter sp.]|uniref:NAD-dependent epimerase/dehydratase family protein n=1 Tax=Ilumatobacter sp. TaxID=1967498 RepID=UPI003B51B477
MRVLVTGGSSAIGGAVARHLAGRGDRVRVFQRRWSEVVGADVEQVLGDVTDPDAVRHAARDQDAVIHLAARVGVAGDRADYHAVNVDGTRHVIAAARAHGVRRFVHVSSPSVAHRGEPILGAGADPAVTDHLGAHYPETKAVAELLALAADSDELAVVVVRPHLVWGPGDEQLVGRIVERARAGRLAIVGGGRALVDSTYLDDAAGALVAALDAVAPGARCAGRAYVVSNGEPRPIRDLVAGICAAAEVPFAPRDVPLGVARRVGSAVEWWWRRSARTDEPPLTRFLADQLGTAHWFDPRPARRDLGWSPSTTLDEGFAALRRWFATGEVAPPDR